MFEGGKGDWILYIPQRQASPGLDLGLNSKLLGLRTWKDGSGIDPDREN